MLGLIALVTVPLLLLAAVSTWRGIAAAEARVAEERVALARAASLRAAAFVEGNLTTAVTLALTPLIADPSSYPDLADLLNRWLAANPDWEGAGVADPDGWNIVNTAAPPRTLTIGDRPYFREAVATNQPVVSPPVLNRRTGNPTVVLAVPVDLRSGGRGALIVALSLARLAAELQALSAGGGARLILVDAQGSVFIHPDPSRAQALASWRGRPEVEAVLAGRSGSLVAVDEGGDETLVAYAPEPGTGWGVLVVEPTARAFDLVRRRLAEQAALIGVAVATTAALGWHLGRRLNRSYRAELAARAAAEQATDSIRALSAESEDRRRFLEDLIRNAPVAIAVLEGPEHRFVTVNPAYQAIKPNLPMLGRTLAEVFPEPSMQDRRERLDRVFRTGERDVLVDQRTELDNASGHAVERYFTSVVSCYDDAQGRPLGLLVVATETTEAVLARQRAERQKDEFLSTASHELKTPLTSLGLSAQMIERMVSQGPLDPERLERLARSVQVQVNRASGLIGELLDFSRLAEGGASPRSEPVDLAQLARAAAQRERDALPDDDPHEILVELLESNRVVVRGDEARLDQVLTNLLANAVKYSPDGGLVHLRVGRRDGWAELSVSDQGIGVPEGDQETLFAAFGRAANARASGIEGTGLGLYISRRIVEAHGGSIAVCDTPGGGATFTVSLPLADKT